MRRFLRSGVGLGAAVCLAAACSSAPPAANTSQATSNLEVVSWWTSGSESAALKALINGFTAANPGVTVQNAAVAGGGGSNVQVVLATRLRDNQPPDVWQTFIGASTQEYARRGLVLDVSSVYASGNLASVMPKQIVDAVTVDGKQWSVPTGSHRSNVLFYNKKLLAQAGVAEPGSGYTTSQLVADLGKVKGAGVAALCLGGKDAFASAELFENVLLSVVGADGWKQIASDQFDWSGSQAQSALGTFGQVLDNADPAAGGQTWDQATKKLASGQCAFESFNDSAYGELEADGAVEGTDFGVVPFPGTEKNYLAVVDAFVAGQGAKNGKNAMGFLTVVGSPTTTVAFNKAKGSVPLRSDVDMSSFPPYQRSAAESLRSGTILLSIVHGEAMTPSFTQGLYDAVSAYVKGRDARAFAQTLSDAVNSAAQVPAAH